MFKRRDWPTSVTHPPSLLSSLTSPLSFLLPPMHTHRDACTPSCMGKRRGRSSPAPSGPGQSCAWSGPSSPTLACVGRGEARPLLPMRGRGGARPRPPVHGRGRARARQRVLLAELRPTCVPVPATATIFGLSPRSARNVVASLCVYAAICRKEGLMLRWPGPRVAWEGFSDASDAELVAEHALWAPWSPMARTNPSTAATGTSSSGSSYGLSSPINAA